MKNTGTRFFLILSIIINIVFLIEFYNIKKEPSYDFGNGMEVRVHEKDGLFLDLIDSNVLSYGIAILTFFLIIMLFVVIVTFIGNSISNRMNGSNNNLYIVSYNIWDFSSSNYIRKEMMSIGVNEMEAIKRVRELVENDARDFEARMVNVIMGKQVTITAKDLLEGN